MDEPSEELPEPVRERLRMHYRAAEEHGLNPEWMEDGKGVEFDCPEHQGSEEEHRASIRYEPQVVPLFLMPLLERMGAIQGADVPTFVDTRDQAHGPAG